IYYTGTAGNGTPGNRFRFTGGQRAAARTQVQGHPVDTTRGVQEYVTTEPTAWRGRRARIYVAEIYPDNSIGTWSEYWRGLLDSAPSMSGDTITIRIAPMTVALNWQVGQGATAARTRVVPGWHALTRGVASELQADVTFERERLFKSTV
ncbi:hypothetical protein LRR18_16775, partial [Mangrovimonas sp. AS39]|uniref:hypothetical protein n=1 Tax=Mangrovimonas futianensis TaxID=2895523 RepID=UPI001E3C016C